MLDYLVHLTDRLGQWGYAVIFLGAMLESAAFLGVFVPGESLVLVAGFLSAQGLLDLGDLIVVVTIGATLGDNIGYELGSRLGRPWALHYGRRIGVTEARLLRAEQFFSRYGGKAVFLGRFVGFARALVPFIAGSTRMRYRVFLGWNALGAALWAASFVLLGYFLGASWQSAERWMGRASAIIGGAALIIMALAWFWGWLVRHEREVREHWAHFLSDPRIVALRKRYAPQIRFLQERFSPKSYLGLELTLGALVLIAASWLFGGIAEDVLTSDPLTVVDVQVAQWLRAHTEPALTTFMLLISRLHNADGIIGLFAITAVVFIVRREWHWLLALALAVPGGMLLNVMTKYAFSRARPVFDDPVLVLMSYSFPSGHVMASVLFYGLLASFIVARAQRWRWKVSALLSAFLIVVLVAFSRVYLGVHYLSDVLAAFAEGVAWLALCITGINTFKHRRYADK